MTPKEPCTSDSPPRCCRAWDKCAPCRIAEARGAILTTRTAGGGTVYLPIETVEALVRLAESAMNWRQNRELLDR